MKRRISKIALVAAIGFSSLTSAAWADFKCSNATLAGEYAFGVVSYTPAGEPNGPPSVAAGIKFFDGQGTLEQRDYRGDALRTAGQTDFAPLGSETGTYTVNPDCTGSMTLKVAGGVLLEIRFVVSDGGRHIHEVVARLTPPGLPPQPVQTSADDWKVASEQDQQQ